MSTEHIIQVEKNIQTRSVRGRFRYLKTAIMVLAYGVYFILPWVRWERPYGPDQIVLFDIPGRPYYLMDLVMHAQDVFWLAALLFLAAVLLFFVTSLLGRVFCGYFCFQTLWTDAFRYIEHWIQGERSARVRLDKAAWTTEKILKKGATHATWLLLSFWTGLTFVLYWGDAFELTEQFFTVSAPSAAYFTTFLLMASTYIAAGWMREYVCLHVCPYSRFQSVMFDQNTLIVSYDANRGESSAGRVKPIKDLRDLAKRQSLGHGDCIDCGYCVQVCPSGIDIRDGLQVACIHCALCVDACDSIMDKQGWQRGLIRYTSENDLNAQPTQFWRLKTVGYGMATLLAVIYLFWSISSAKQLEATAAQIRNPLYVALSDGRIRNSYELKINNKSMSPARYRLTLEGLAQAELSLGELKDIRLLPDSSLRVFVKVLAQIPEGVAKNRAFTFRLIPLEGEVTEAITIPANFISP